MPTMIDLLEPLTPWGIVPGKTTKNNILDLIKNEEIKIIDHSSGFTGRLGFMNANSTGMSVRWKPTFLDLKFDWAIFQFHNDAIRRCENRTTHHPQNLRH